MDLTRFLSEHGIAATRHQHPPVMTVEESLRLVPKLPGAKTKNLFLRDKKGRRHGGLQACLMSIRLWRIARLRLTLSSI